MSSGKWRPSCLRLNVLSKIHVEIHVSQQESYDLASDWQVALLPANQVWNLG